MIKVENISKKFNDIVALNHVTFMIPSSKRVVLQGPSGSGKTTLLRLIAGLDNPTSGKIIKDEEKISFAFQNDLLLEELNVYQNIAYGLYHRLYSKEEIDKKVRNISSLFLCDSYLNQKTSTLSGGQKQRISLARALISQPDLLCIDEAFNSLDKDLRIDLIQKIIDIQQKTGMTILYVSHDQWDAKIMGEMFITLENGQIKNID